MNPKMGFVSRSTPNSSATPAYRKMARPTSRTIQRNQVESTVRVIAAGNGLPQALPRDLGLRQASPSTTNDTAIATAAAPTAIPNGTGSSCRPPIPCRGSSKAVTGSGDDELGDELVALVRLDLEGALHVRDELHRCGLARRQRQQLVVAVHVHLVRGVADGGDQHRLTGL